MEEKLDEVRDELNPKSAQRYYKKYKGILDTIKFLDFSVTFFIHEFTKVFDIKDSFHYLVFVIH